MVPVMVITLFAKRVIYTHYATTPRLWGLSALDDQALAWGLMGVVDALVYFGAFLTLVMRMALHEQRMTERQESVDRQRAEAEIEPTTVGGGWRRW
jgi:cytochrome c oxidase assembly factor CtaG